MNIVWTDPKFIFLSVGMPLYLLTHGTPIVWQQYNAWNHGDDQLTPIATLCNHGEQKSILQS